MTVQVEKFGKDHWSTFAYIETVCVDRGGVPDRARMRCDSHRHPWLAHEIPGVGAGERGSHLPRDTKYPTRLAGGEGIADHDDWDCADDLEAAGLVEQVGTGVNPVFKLTEAGQVVASRLRAWKSKGGNFAAFKMTAP